MSSPANVKRKLYLHESVSRAIESRIASRELLPGDLLPGEIALAEEFSVSRSVVRQSLRTLDSRGLVQIVPGRGTVVATANEWHRDAQRMEGLSAQMRTLGVRVTTNVVQLERIKSTGRSLAFGTSSCYLLERVRHVDSEPVAFIRTYLPPAVGERLVPEELEDGSLHDAMHRTTGTDVLGGDRQIRAIAATGRIAEHLDLAVGSPVLLLEGSSLDQDSKVVEVFSTWHRSDRIALDLNAYSTQPKTQERAGELQELATQVRSIADRLGRLGASS